MNALSLVATIIVLVAVAVLILIFERKRAQRIEQDLRNQARGHRAAGEDSDGRQD